MSLIGKNLLTNFFSSRSSLTCTYKCGNACFGRCSNTSSNEYFGAVTRRSALRTGGLLTLALGGGAFAPTSPAAAAAAGPSTRSGPGSSFYQPSSPGLQFTPVLPNTSDSVTVPDGYTYNILMSWGDPLFSDTPAFDVNAQTAAKQERQFGFNNDFAGLFEHPTDCTRLVYVCSHEYTTEPHMHPRYDAENPTEEQVNIGLAAHGQTILEVQKDPCSGNLTALIDAPLNRRITGNTPFTLTGPAAGSCLVTTCADPCGTTVLGTLNNCSGGITPWGTYLSGEENIDQYFAHLEALEGRAHEGTQRMGIKEGATERLWENFHPRFDLAVEPNEVNRFGYIVEINPFDPASTPVKHTALGRFKHEAGNVHVTNDGTVVCYSGDDERFEYIYKFVSSRKIIEGDTCHNMTILDAGTLYVASLQGNSCPTEIDGAGTLPSDGTFDGTGIWHPLVTAHEDGSATSHVAGFTPEEVCVYTRLAADQVGATKMDRPEDFQTNPATGLTYVALTNNKYRGATGEDASFSKEDVTEYAPIRENKNGLVMEIDDQHAGTCFTWNLLLVCGDPDEAYSYFGGFDKTQVSPISCPDNLAFDPYGNLWISTDGNALGTHDGLYSVELSGENRGQVKCFLTVPTEAETCGPIICENRVLVNVQHPGEGDESTVENPSSTWPDGPGRVPRPSAVVIWREDGGNIGLEAHSN
ncbi:PhoX family protein [Rothia nasisuis]|uniref:PhoX family protein n=1 Tax=Rothia nasisuis TaxID=2109647 RepID=UPI001F2A3BED|nr:PhoX family phosphatase [Rothia nasisuis]